MTTLEDDHRCEACNGPIVGKRRGSRFCDECSSPAKRQARSRRHTAQVVTFPTRDRFAPKDYEKFGRKRINIGHVLATGSRRIDKGDAEGLKNEMRPFYTHLGVITRVAQQTGGYTMPKFPLPGWPPFAPQFSPDKPPILNPLSKWQKHDRVIPDLVLADGRVVSRKVLALVKRDKKMELVPLQWAKQRRTARGKLKRETIYGYEYSLDLLGLDEHLERCRNERYNRKTGEGDHRGVNVEGWHRHAPEEAKYLNFGDNKYIDCGSGGLDEILAAFNSGRLRQLILVLEGWHKYLAAKSNGWYGVAIGSITLWLEKQMRWFAHWVRENLPGVPVFLNPDADWADFDRNRGAVFRATMRIQAILEEELLDVSMIAPPKPTSTAECECKPGQVTSADTCAECGGYFKALDDWYGAGGVGDRLVVVTRRAPKSQILEHMIDLGVSHQRRTTLYRALCRLSLHDRDDHPTIPGRLKTLQKVIGARRPQDVPRILEDLGSALELGGSLEIAKRAYFDLKRERWGEAWDWVNAPTIRVAGPFRATETVQRLGQLEGGNYEGVSHEMIPWKEVHDGLDRVEAEIESLPAPRALAVVNALEVLLLGGVSIHVEEGRPLLALVTQAEGPT